MYIQIGTGKDSFRATGRSPARNDQVTAYTFVDGKMKPLFAACKDNDAGFGTSQILQSIDASSRFRVSSGTWMINSHEVSPDTIILVEYTKKRAGTFGLEQDWLLLRVDPDAALYSITINLSTHEFADVPNLPIEGRFDLIETEDEVPGNIAPVLSKYFGCTKEEVHFAVAHVDDGPFEVRQLDERRKTKTKATVIETATGEARVQFRRGRRLRPSVKD